MIQLQRRKLAALGALLLILTGAASCSTCVLVRSEYYDVTGKVYAPKPDDQDIPILAQAPDRPYIQIGAVNVQAPWGTNHAALDTEMKSRARKAGADALIQPVYEENKDNKMVFCGKVFDTKKSVTARGTAIVYDDKGPHA